MKKGNVGWIVIGWIILSIVIAVSVGGDNVTQTFFIVGIGGSAALLIIIGVKDWTSKKQKQQIEEEERERNLLAKDKENQQIRNDYNILNENPSVNILVKGFLSNYGFEMMQPIESFLSIDMYFLSQDNDYCKYIYTEYGDIHRYITSSAIYDIEGYLPEDFIKLTKVLEKHHNSEYIELLTWMLLKDISVQEWHLKFQDEYGVYFNSIATKKFDEYIKAYIKIYDDRLFDVTEKLIPFIHFLKAKGIVTSDNTISVYNTMNPHLEKIIEISEKENSISNFEKSLLDKDIRENTKISDVDLLSGEEFEEFLVKLFKALGFSAHKTKASYDQGIDVIAEKASTTYGIQAKCYSSSVPNSSVQEVVAGISYYELDKAMVITNNYFTKSAISLAEKNAVILWDRDKLIQQLEQTNI